MNPAMPRCKALTKTREPMRRGALLTIRSVFRAPIFPVTGDIDLAREFGAIVAPHDSAAKIERYSEPESGRNVGVLRMHTYEVRAPQLLSRKHLLKAAIMC